MNIYYVQARRWTEKSVSVQHHITLFQWINFRFHNCFRLNICWISFLLFSKWVLSCKLYVWRSIYKVLLCVELKISGHCYRLSCYRCTVWPIPVRHGSSVCCQCDNEKILSLSPLPLVLPLMLPASLFSREVHWFFCRLVLLSVSFKCPKVHGNFYGMSLQEGQT